jgi:hypothetical protein
VADAAAFVFCPTLRFLPLADPGTADTILASARLADGHTAKLVASEFFLFLGRERRTRGHVSEPEPQYGGHPLDHAPPKHALAEGYGDPVNALVVHRSGSSYQ